MGCGLSCSQGYRAAATHYAATPLPLSLTARRSAPRLASLRCTPDTRWRGSQPSKLLLPACGPRKECKVASRAAACCCPASALRPWAQAPCLRLALEGTPSPRGARGWPVCAPWTRWCRRSAESPRLLALTPATAARPALCSRRDCHLTISACSSAQHQQRSGSSVRCCC
ncbi:hypothetical protein FA09DRAFT_139922 [Tilletiopsis washingtonensis]|jgi:hypothetical protein|uniref:Uncharacterized protein n=1 Tax=Tilletiopsis washingtonensis TaxID=58919 RepID=A0A316Z393_9BASI|nr:hypothetical protein FA09DRAFT_139922 [Tilletiopsis washingtonensis]PWN95428.1 hypothetical protein FA09DRAFT_139922 [Tilletiopsis washingtonensis]